MDGEDWTKTVPSETDPGKTYTVKLKDGVFSCTCMAWRTQKSPITHRTCKHLIQVLGADVERARAPESFYGLTRSRAAAAIEPVHFMSYHRFDETKRDQNVVGWYFSVKLNGAFGRWTNGKLLTKSGRELHPPVSITDHLPRDVDLDGEIYSPIRQNVRKALANHWPATGKVEYVVFDLYDQTLPFKDRLKKLEHLHRKYKFKMVHQQKISSDSDLTRAMELVRKQKEEGLVLRNPLGMYEAGRRSHDTLKWKPASKGSGVVQKIEAKKIGRNFIVKEDGTGVVFRVYSRACQAKMGDRVRFVFYGRDEHEKPELPQLICSE